MPKIVLEAQPTKNVVCPNGCGLIDRVYAEPFLGVSEQTVLDKHLRSCPNRKRHDKRGVK